MAKKQVKKPKVIRNKSPRVVNRAHKVTTAQSLKKGFIIPSNGGFQ